jgi:hypothetical protein
MKWNLGKTPASLVGQYEMSVIIVVKNTNITPYLRFVEKLLNWLVYRVWSTNSSVGV